MVTDRLGLLLNYFYTLLSSYWAVMLRQLRSFLRYIVISSTRSAGYKSLRKVGISSGGVNTRTIAAS